MSSRDASAAFFPMTWLIDSIRRFLFIAAVAFWLGGFTFYTSVVIPVGTRTLGSVRQGFITQQVTGWLNLAGAVALPLIFWNMAAVWGARSRPLRFALVATWVIMALVEVELFALHPAMDRLLDIRAKHVLDYGRFDHLHYIYLMSSTFQWAAGLIHVWCAGAGRERQQAFAIMSR
jgi:hypothetical protein